MLLSTPLDFGLLRGAPRTLPRAPGRPFGKPKVHQARRRSDLGGHKDFSSPLCVGSVFCLLASVLDFGRQLLLTGNVCSAGLL